jgi:hypothetical protein
MLAAVVLAMAAGACGGPSPAGGAHAPAEVDRWTPPRVSGPPSAANFCTLLLASYKHVNTVASLKDVKVRDEVLGDWVKEVPPLLAEAPPTIAAPAKVYLTAVAGVLDHLARRPMTSADAGGSTMLATLTNPAVVQAGNQLFAFSRQYCHYDLSSQSAT